MPDHQLEGTPGERVEQVFLPPDVRDRRLWQQVASGGESQGSEEAFRQAGDEGPPDDSFGPGRQFAEQFGVACRGGCIVAFADDPAQFLGSQRHLPDMRLPFRLVGLQQRLLADPAQVERQLPQFPLPCGRQGGKRQGVSSPSPSGPG
ncbi:hypothetical protein [Streptomyces sp. NPDC005827]|uniref:hypothetical protein n=1 Tax=Streptomyces sp. NPDC005827 TaxID=3157070 RepID=UPI0033DC4191